MTLKCSAVIDNPLEKERFVRKLKGLGLKPTGAGNIVYVEYRGYNKTKYDLIIDLFEDRTRHLIETDYR